MVERRDGGLIEESKETIIDQGSFAEIGPTERRRSKSDLVSFLAPLSTSHGRGALNIYKERRVSRCR